MEGRVGNRPLELISHDHFLSSWTRWVGVCLETVSHKLTLTSIIMMTDEHTPEDGSPTTPGPRDWELRARSAATDARAEAATQMWVRAGFHVPDSQMPNHDSPATPGSGASVPNEDFELYSRRESAGASGVAFFGSPGSSIKSFSPVSLGGYRYPQSPTRCRTPVRLSAPDDLSPSSNNQIDEWIPIGSRANRRSPASASGKRHSSLSGIDESSSMRMSRQPHGQYVLPTSARSRPSSSQSNPTSGAQVEIHHLASSSLVPTSRASMPPPSSRDGQDQGRSRRGWRGRGKGRRVSGPRFG